MQVYLTEEELDRESSLLSPSETQYKLLPGVPYDVRLYVEPSSDKSDDAPLPSTC